MTLKFSVCYRDDNEKILIKILHILLFQSMMFISLSWFKDFSGGGGLLLGRVLLLGEALYVFLANTKYISNTFAESHLIVVWIRKF